MWLLDKPPHYHRFALTGYPLGHSLSPRIHHAALGALKLQGEYLLCPIPPEQAALELPQMFREIRSGDLDGLNVTIPHKQAVLSLCDRHTPSVQAIGAANLIYLRDDLIIGDNSDAPGFLAGLSLAPSHWQPTSRCALVLGAGGSARAVVYALLSTGWKVRLLARRLSQAEEMRRSFQSLEYIAGLETGLMEPPAFVNSLAELIVNTTPLGMAPNPNASPWPEQIPFPSGALVYDLVYNPHETLLISQARAQGCPTIGGIHMLVEQAAISFEKWTGLPAPRAEMLTAVYS
jgi:shikimate dehydrogenase